MGCEYKIVINGETYVKESTQAEAREGMPYMLVRTYSAGVFAGYMETRNGKEVTLREARRIWYWSGAASLSQLAKDGTKDPGNCKFPCAVDSVVLTEAIELIACTDEARKSIQGVPVWEK